MVRWLRVPYSVPSREATSQKATVCVKGASSLVNTEVDPSLLVSCLALDSIGLIRCWTCNVELKWISTGV